MMWRDFDPLPAVHRMEVLEVTQALYEFPEKFDFEKAFNRTFVVMKEDAFRLKVEECIDWKEVDGS